MTKTQLNFELPVGMLSFTSSKVDNSASTDPNMPADKSPDFYYEGTKGDGTTQQVSLYYDITDNYNKKLLVNGVTTNLTTDGADDAVTNISLEGATNPLTFLLEPLDLNPAYIHDATTGTTVALQQSGGNTTTVIADSTTFEDIYTSLTGLPAPVDMTIIFKTPNPLVPNERPVKSFTLNNDIQNGYLTFTFVRDDSSTFTLTLEDADVPLTVGDLTLTKVLTIIDSGTTLTYACSANITFNLVQLSGYVFDNVAGTYIDSPETIQPLDILGAYNPQFDGFRVVLITSLTEISIGGDTILTNPSDSGVVITMDMARRAVIAQHFRRLKKISHKATAKFMNPLKAILAKRKLKK